MSMTLFATIPPEFWAALVPLMLTLNMILQWWFKRELKADVTKGNDLTQRTLIQSKANANALEAAKDESSLAKTEAKDAKVEARKLLSAVQEVIAEQPDKPRHRYEETDPARPTPPPRVDPQ